MTCPTCKKTNSSFVNCPLKNAPVCMTCCWNCPHMSQKDTSIPKCRAIPLDKLVED